jgi:hypothetical protein
MKVALGVSFRTHNKRLPDIIFLIFICVFPLLFTYNHNNYLPPPFLSPINHARIKTSLLSLR